MRASRIPTLILLAALAGGAFGCGSKTTAPANRPPRFIDLIARPASVVPGGVARLSALVSDPDGDALRYSWSADGGTFSDSTTSVTNWTAPFQAGTYAMTVTATDGTDAVSRSVTVGVGSAKLTVVSDPAGAFVYLDGDPTGFTTPATIAPLAPGLHIAAVSSPFFAYSPPSEGRTLADADQDTVFFGIDPPQVSTLDPDRGDLLEIGGIAFLPDGGGVVYAGRTPAGTGLYSTSTFSSTPGGVLLWEGVRMQEPLGVTTDGGYVLFVSDTDSLYALPIDDTVGDGVIDMVGTAIPLRKNAFGPAVSRTGQIAFSLSPSDEPAGAQIFSAAFSSGALSGVQLATTSFGRLPAWKPGGAYLAFMRNGLILVGYTGTGGPASPDTLVGDGYNTAPAWGKWGPEHIAYLHGSDAMNVTELRLAAVGTPYTATIATNLQDPRFVAWSPAAARLLVTQNPPGGPQILVVDNLPVP